MLDVACGTGNAAIPAAAAGGKVTGLDITPELFEDGRRNAAEAGVEIEWIEGDAEELPFEDESFDVVALDLRLHVRAGSRGGAAEIARVLKPGGRLGIAAWRPEGTIGQFFVTIAKHAPPPPQGFQPPPLWGVRDHVSRSSSSTPVAVRFEDNAAHLQFDSVEQMVEEYATKFGPVVVLREALEAEGGWEALRDDLLALYERTTRPEDGGVAFDADYLITLGERAE